MSKNTPSLPSNIDPSIRAAIAKIAETVDTGAGVRGKPDDRYIRISDLVDMGIAKKLAKNAQALVAGVNLVSNNAPILDIPPQPSNFEVVGGLGLVFLNWDNARNSYANHGYTEIWRAEEDNLSNAVLIQQETSSFGSLDRNATYGVQYYYWIRFVSTSDIKGPYNSSVGTPGKLAEDPAILLEMLEGEITATELHASLTSRIDLIDAPSTGLVAQSLANANNIVNEVNARLSLAQQLRGDYTGSALSGVTTGLLRQEILAREASINQLSSQMALLTAGSNTQFDYVVMFYFDTGLEGWTGATFNSATGGWIRPNLGVLVPIKKMFGGAGQPPVFDGKKYTQVRGRIKKIGNPTWNGGVWYRTADAPGTEYTTGMGAEPSFDADGIAYFTFTASAPWTTASAITEISLALYTNTNSSNYYEIDWIGVGRPSPGASSAELFTEQQARLAADLALASDITIANAAIAGKASQSSVDTLSGRVTTAENTITTQGNKLTALDGQFGATSLLLNPNFAQWSGFYPDSWNAWDGTGLSQHTGSFAYSGGKAAQYSTNASVNGGFRQDITQNVDYLDFELVFTLTSGSLSGAGLHVEWANSINTVFIANVALKDLYSASEILNKKVVCKARVKRPAAFTGTFSVIRVYVMANYAGSSLGSLATKTIIFDTVFASVPDASANAIQSLDTRLTTAESGITSQSSQLTQLRNSIALNTNALDVSTWVAGSTGSQGVSGQPGYWASSHTNSTESRIVTAGNSGVPAGPFGGSELMWECQDAGDGDASGGYNVNLLPYNKISKQRGCVFATFFRHNGLTNGSVYHGFDFGGIVNMDGSPNGNPYSVAHGVGGFASNRWYLLYGIVHPHGSQISDTGLSGVYDCTTGERVIDCPEFRMGASWDSEPQLFRNYLYYSTDTAHKCWFARPRVVPLDSAPTPHELMRYDSRTYANSQAISSLNSSVSTINGTLTTQASQITALQGDVAGKASSSALNSLSSTVTSQGAALSAQATSITQLAARIPGGANLLPDSEFIGTNFSGWNFWNQGGGSTTTGRNLAGTSWTPAGYNQIGMTRSGAQTGVMHIYSNRMPVEPNKRYCFSANIAGHRCTLRLIISWFDASNNYITEAQNGSWSQTGGNDLSNGQWTRREVFAASPSNARYAEAVLRGEDTGENDEYLWLCRPMFSEVAAETTVAPPYEPAVKGSYAAISEEASVRAAADGTIMANKVLKLDVNGKVAGWGAMNTGTESIMEFAFDKVAFYSPGNTSLVLGIDGGKVVMDGAFIKNATINTAQVGSLNAVKITAASITTDKIQIGAVSSQDQFFSAGSWQTISSSSIAFDQSIGSFNCSGSGVNIFLIVRMNFGALVEAFPPSSPSLTSTVDSIRAGISLKVDGTSVAITSDIKKKILIGSNHGAIFVLPLVYRGSLSAGSRSLSFAVDATFYNSSGVTVASSGKVLASATLIAQENKV